MSRSLLSGQKPRRLRFMNAPHAMISRLKIIVSHKIEISKLSSISSPPASAQPAVAPAASVHDGKGERQPAGYSGRSTILSHHSA